MIAHGFQDTDTALLTIAAVTRFCALLLGVYADLGFSSITVALATRPAQRAGNDAVWDRAEASLAAAARAAGLQFDILEGEGTFYGPKLELQLADIRGRKWQCGTVQLDFVLPARLGAQFVNHEIERETPGLEYHAVLGSIERFIAILLNTTMDGCQFGLLPTRS
jgi:threonyl-tRNA synthetase